MIYVENFDILSRDQLFELVRKMVKDNFIAEYKSQYSTEKKRYDKIINRMSSKWITLKKARWPAERLNPALKLYASEQTVDVRARSVVFKYLTGKDWDNVVVFKSSREKV